MVLLRSSSSRSQRSEDEGLTRAEDWPVSLRGSSSRSQRTMDGGLIEMCMQKADWFSYEELGLLHARFSQLCLEDGPDAVERRPESGFPIGRGTRDGHLEAHHDLQATPAIPGKATRLGVRGSIVLAASRSLMLPIAPCDLERSRKPSRSFEECQW
uniref:Uncharacterized protein n=1 Tax=Nelumbo nucifera TaxID=4432 RepID=A0A822Y0X1_NELNU|nr:TPA_asm: hypothetical protein HUJ06_027390 [Nelumbo nucifera]